MARVPELGEAVLVQPLARDEAVGKTGERRLQQLRQALVRAGECGSQRDPEEVERGRERKNLEVRDRDDPLLVDDDERVRAGRVQLVPELGGRELERVARRAE